jgi:hypothetical protein
MRKLTGALSLLLVVGLVMAQPAWAGGGLFGGGDDTEITNTNTNRNNNDATGIGVGVGLGLGVGVAGADANASADALSIQGQKQRQNQRQRTDVDVNTDVSTEIDNDVTGVNLGIVKGTQTTKTKSESGASSDNAVEITNQIGGDSNEYTDESITASIATSPQKSEIQAGVPGLGLLTLSDPDRFTMYQLTVATTLELYKAGLLTPDEAKERAARQLDRLEKQSNKPNGRTLLNGFGLLW